MRYKAVLLNVNGVGGQDIIKLMESQMNMYAEQGFIYVDKISLDPNRIIVIMGKHNEKRGRSGKTEEPTEMMDD